MLYQIFASENTYNLMMLKKNSKTSQINEALVMLIQSAFLIVIPIIILFFLNKKYQNSFYISKLLIVCSFIPISLFVSTYNKKLKSLLEVKDILNLCEEEYKNTEDEMNQRVLFSNNTNNNLLWHQPIIDIYDRYQQYLSASNSTITINEFLDLIITSNPNRYLNTKWSINGQNNSQYIISSETLNEQFNLGGISAQVIMESLTSTINNFQENNIVNNDMDITFNQNTNNSQINEIMNLVKALNIDLKNLPSKITEITIMLEKVKNIRNDIKPVVDTIYNHKNTFNQVFKLIGTLNINLNSNDLNTILNILKTYNFGDIFAQTNYIANYLKMKQIPLSNIFNVISNL